MSSCPDVGLTAEVRSMGNAEIRTNLARILRWRHRLLLVLALFVGAWSVSRLTAPSPGSLEYQFSRISPGMRYEEALALLPPDGWGIRTYSKGTTKDGQPFFMYLTL